MPDLKKILHDKLFVFSLSFLMRVLATLSFFLSSPALFADAYAVDKTEKISLAAATPNLLSSKDGIAEKAATGYKIYGGENWSAPELEGKLFLNSSEFFGKVSFGAYRFSKELRALYRFTVGWRNHVLGIAMSSEKNTLEALLPYTVNASEYYGGALRLAFWADAEKNITFSYRSVLASVSAPQIYEKRQFVLMNTFAQQLKIIETPVMWLELNSSLDLLLDVDRVGNKLGFRLNIPFFYNIERSFKGKLQLGLAHVQLSSRQVEGRILDAYIYQISNDRFATNLLKLEQDFRFYPFKKEFFNSFFLGFSSFLGAYHLDPDPIEALYLNYRLAFAAGWGDFEQGFLGMQLYYDLLNNWKVAFYVSQSW